MIWQLLILASVILSSISVLLQRIFLKNDENDPIAFSIFFQIALSLLVGLFGLLFGKMSFTNLIPLYLNLFLSAFLYGVGNVFIFVALRHIEASLFTIIFASRAVITILASTILLQESLIFSQLIGTVLILTGVVFASLETAKLRFSKLNVFAILAAIFFGLAITNDRFILKSVDIFPYVFIQNLISASIIAIIKPKSFLKIKTFFGNQIFLKAFIICAIYAAATISFFSALQISNNLSQVASINITSVVLTVLLASIFLKEKNNIPQKLLGAISAMAGVFLAGR